MIKGITKDAHGFADYSYIPAVLAMPTLAGFKEDEKAAAVCRAFAGVVLGYSLLTDAKWGAVKLIPYKTHAILDFSVGVAAVAAPAVFGIANKRAKTTLFLMGLTGLVVGALSIIGASRK